MVERCVVKRLCEEFTSDMGLGNTCVLARNTLEHTSLALENPRCPDPGLK